MSSKKKLQVFVSSTYQDLRDERQGAVEAILTAGHIPAGMELFAAGDESQMNVIRRWIRESDVFLLILGGRYGSIDSNSGLSYVHLEYREALLLQKPMFAVVVDDKHQEKRVKRFGTVVVETENPTKLKEFRKEVLTRLVRFWSDPRDIKVSIYETLSELSTREELTGWVRGDQSMDVARIVDELARLTRENSELRSALAAKESLQQTYHGLSFGSLVQLLSAEHVPINNASEDRDDQAYVSILKSICERSGCTSP